MAYFSTRSKQRLATCDQRLQCVCNRVIEVFDFTVLHGHRSLAEQFALFREGRQLVDGEWVIEDRSKVITYCDGAMKKSNHNYEPSRAVDVVPYPINWEDHARIHYLAGFVMMAAVGEGVALRWGGDWDQDTQVRDEVFSDLLHFELINP